MMSSLRDYSSVVMLGLAFNRTVLYDDGDCRWCWGELYLDAFYEPLSNCQTQYLALKDVGSGPKLIHETQVISTNATAVHARSKLNVYTQDFPHWVWRSLSSLHTGAITYTNSTDGKLMSEAEVELSYDPELLLALKTSVFRALLAKVRAAPEMACTCDGVEVAIAHRLNTLYLGLLVHVYTIARSSACVQAPKAHRFENI
jgi:hypothetical protein